MSESIFPDRDIRKDLVPLCNIIKGRFSSLISFFAGNPKLAEEWEECKRLSKRFEAWTKAYNPDIIRARFDREPKKDKERELLRVLNKLYDATTQLLISTKDPTWSSNSALTVSPAIFLSTSWKDDSLDTSGENDLDSSSDDGRKRRPSRAIPDEKRTEKDIKEQYERLLLKIAHQLYEVERFNFGRGRAVQDLYTAHLNEEKEIDQEEKDLQREVYKPLYEGENDMTIINKLLNSIRERHVAAPPMRDWESRLEELVPDTEPTVTDGPRQRRQGR